MTEIENNACRIAGSHVAENSVTVGLVDVGGDIRVALIAPPGGAAMTPDYAMLVFNMLGGILESLGMLDDEIDGFIDSVSKTGGPGVAH